MERKDEPPAYSPPPGNQSQPQNLYQYPAQTQNQNQYPAQTNYGFSQPTQYNNTSQSGVVVHTVNTVGNVYQAAPQDYTTQAWLACLCCFWPTGIMAIMRAQESRDAVACGDMARAHTAAQGARQMVRVSVIVGIVSAVIAVIFVIVYVVLMMSYINDSY